MSGPVNESQKINNLRRNLTLDLNQTKKTNSLNVPASLKPILSSPDLNMLKVDTPDLEKMILENGGIATSTPTPLLFPRAVTEEQESFATGFVNALNNLHNSNSVNSTSSTLSQASDNSSGGTVYTELDQSNINYNIPPVVKEEPQTVPNLNTSTPPMSPVDMEAQERIKLERKRQRNRLAASKCRTRKLERISRLEEKVKHLKTENAELAAVLNQLKQHVTSLKEEVLLHVRAGCSVMETGRY